METKTAWYQYRNRHAQWQRVEDAVITSCNYSYLIFDKSKGGGGRKEEKKIDWKKTSLTNGAGKFEF